MLSAGVDMAEKLSLCFYVPVSQLVVKIVCLSAYHCSVDEAVHLRKVGRFPAISAHLRKVEFRRCTHGMPSGEDVSENVAAQSLYAVAEGVMVAILSERSDIALPWGGLGEEYLLSSVQSCRY